MLPTMIMLLRYGLDILTILKDNIYKRQLEDLIGNKFTATNDYDLFVHFFLQRSW